MSPVYLAILAALAALCLWLSRRPKNKDDNNEEQS